MEQITPSNTLAGCRFRPLSHTSKLQFLKTAAKTQLYQKFLTCVSAIFYELLNLYFLLPQDNPIRLAFLRIFSFLCRAQGKNRTYFLSSTVIHSSH